MLRNLLDAGEPAVPESLEPQPEKAINVASTRVASGAFFMVLLGTRLLSICS